MATVHEAIEAIEVAEQKRAARKEQSSDLKYKKFYNSWAWRAARYRFLKTQPRPLRCACCGATAQHARLAVDHVVPIKQDWSRRLDPTNFQLLCACDGPQSCGANLAKGSHDATDWRLNVVGVASPRPRNQSADIPVSSWAGTSTTATRRWLHQKDRASTL